MAEREKAQRVFNSAFWVDAKDRPDLKQRKGAGTLGGNNTQVSSPSHHHHTDDEHDDDDIDPLLFKH